MLLSSREYFFHVVQVQHFGVRKRFLHLDFLFYFVSMTLAEYLLYFLKSCFGKAGVELERKPPPISECQIETMASVEAREDYSQRCLLTYIRIDGR